MIDDAFQESYFLLCLLRDHLSRSLIIIEKGSLSRASLSNDLFVDVQVHPSTVWQLTHYCGDGQTQLSKSAVPPSAQSLPPEAPESPIPQ